MAGRAGSFPTSPDVRLTRVNCNGGAVSATLTNEAIRDILAPIVADMEPKVTTDTRIEVTNDPLFGHPREV